MLKTAFPETYAWDINIDPSISLPYFERNVNDVLAGRAQNAEAVVILVGTSLGGWYAAELSSSFHVDAVIINPSWNPSEALKKYGVPEDVRVKYTPMKWPRRAKYFIGKNDEVIDFEPVRSILKELDTEWVDNAGHRFNGPEFQKVIEYIDNLCRGHTRDNHRKAGDPE